VVGSRARWERIVELVAQRQLPAVYEYRGYVLEGGLVSYSADVSDNYRRAASYVDRILKGARPADLPVDQASRFELVINLKTAKALGLTVPPTLLAIHEVLRQREKGLPATRQRIDSKTDALFSSASGPAQQGSTGERLVADFAGRAKSLRMYSRPKSRQRLQVRNQSRIQLVVQLCHRTP